MRFSTLSLLVGAAVFCVAAIAPNGSPASRPNIPAEPAKSGSVLYARVGCIQCHGGVGQGGSEGPQLAKTLLNYEAFAQQVREPANTMPAYSAKILSEEDLRRIYDHVLTMQD